MGRGIRNKFDNGSALTVNGIGRATEIFEAAFLIVTALIIVKEYIQAKEKNYYN